MRARGIILAAALAFCSIASAFEWTSTAPSSQGLQAFGTYTASARVEVQYATGYSGSFEATIPVNCTIQWPEGVTAGVALPAIFVFPAGAYTTTNYADTQDEWEPFATAGAVVITVDYRTSEDTPWTRSNQAGETLIRPVRAAYLDTGRFEAWALQYAQRVTADYTIDPRRVFAAGWSAGGHAALLRAARNGGRYAGVAGAACGVGVDSIGGLTTVIRSFFTEADLTPDAPPVLLMVSEDDAVIGPTWIDALVDAVDDGPNSRVFSKAGTAHEDFEDFGNVDYDAESVTPLEAIRRFFNECMTGLDAARPGKVVAP